MGRITYKIFRGNSNFRKARFKIEFCLRRPRLMLLGRAFSEAFEKLGELGELPGSPYTLDPSSESLPNSSSDSCSCMNALNVETPLRSKNWLCQDYDTTLLDSKENNNKKLILFSFDDLIAEWMDFATPRSQILQNWDGFNLFSVLFIHALMSLPAGKTKELIFYFLFKKNPKCSLAWLYHHC